ncbi:copper amine oxidase N-terminal domain-containing protein [Paenibacillaceae bacterium]|nr:copper amine oxidase N-terminal domain-containing protein [Paenibacillaceae bacterium]
MKSLLQNSFKWLLIISLFVIAAFEAVPVPVVKANVAADQLVLTKNSSEMMYNGQTIQAVQPTTFKDGVSYAPFSSIAKVYGFKVAYEAKTKESIARNEELEIRFKPDSANIKVNGKIVKSSGAVFIQNGYMMIPLRTWADLTGSTLTLKDSEMTFAWSRPSIPEATFSVLNEEIYAGQTKILIADHASSPSGRKIIDQRWEGKQDIYDEPGEYTITRSVMDDRSRWSDPYSVTIHVLKANEPPVAAFSTDKTTYRIGEPVLYTENSYDDENSIVRKTWSGQAPVFFESGDYTISLEVEDGHGATDSVFQQITVTDEVLYTPEEYYPLFTPVGDKFPIVGSSVLNHEEVIYSVLPERVSLARSNSPETLSGEGIVFYSRLDGKIRFLFHHQNRSAENLKIYLVATNPNASVARVRTTAFGMGGPNTYVSTSGKLAVSRYFSSSLDPKDNLAVSLQPGETKVIIPEMSQVPLKPGQVMSAYADLYADSYVEFRVVVVEGDNNPIDALPSLSHLDRDNYHVRGTFFGADRVLEISGRLGEKAQRIPLGDRYIDKYLDGFDEMTGDPERNTGNFGVLYKMKVEVAPRTLIALNPRGGHYAGAFLVNGTVVNTTDNSILKDQNEAGVLYRTGDAAETVDISFVIASGSNTPLQLLFLPLPQLKR